MWERSDLKAKAKVVLKKYYWKSVLVALIAFILTGGMGQVANSASDLKDSFSTTFDENYTEDYEDDTFDSDIGEISLIKNLFGDGFVLLFVNSALLVVILSLIIKLFLVYPITVGKNNYFMGIIEKDKSLDSLLFSYKSGQLTNTIITMFAMDIFVYLWSLLLIIPGLVKSYEYRMIPYILSENPSIGRKRAFEISKNMMNGNKWDVFLLDLSFIGWYILSIITAGILSLLYVNPYVQSTNAQLYAYLREDALEKGYADADELIGF